MTRHRMNTKPMTAGDPINLMIASIMDRQRETLLQFMDFLIAEETMELARESNAVFARIMHSACEDFGLSQSWLAEELQMTNATLSRWVSGKAVAPHYARDTILRAAHRLIKQSDDAAQAAKGPMDWSSGCVTRPRTKSKTKACNL